MATLNEVTVHRGAVAALTDEELLNELQNLIGVTAAHVARLAAVWFELEKRGHDLSRIRSGIAQYLSAVALGRLVPEAVVRLAGNATAIRAMTHLTLDQQRAVLDHGEVSVRRQDGVERVPIQRLTASDVARAFDVERGVVRSVAEQTEPRKYRRRDGVQRRIVVEMTSAQYDKIQAEAARTKRSASALVLQCLKNDGVV